MLRYLASQGIAQEYGPKIWSSLACGPYIYLYLIYYIDILNTKFDVREISILSCHVLSISCCLHLSILSLYQITICQLRWSTQVWERIRLKVMGKAFSPHDWRGARRKCQHALYTDAIYGVYSRSPTKNRSRKCKCTSMLHMCMYIYLHFMYLNMQHVFIHISIQMWCRTNAKSGTN